MEQRIINRYIDLDKISRKEVNFKSKRIEWSQKSKLEVSFVLIEQFLDQEMCIRDRIGRSLDMCIFATLFFNLILSLFRSCLLYTSSSFGGMILNLLLEFTNMDTCAYMQAKVL